MNPLLRPLICLLPVVLSLSTALYAQTDGGGSLPRTIAFIENRGQWDAEARFLARTPGTDLWICRNEIRCDLRPASHPTDPGQNHGTETSTSTAPISHIVTMRFEGALASAAPRGESPLSEHYNYLKGNDPDRWVVGVPLYRSTYIEGLYEGIDARFRLDHGKVRYDLLLRPGADAASIRIRYDGYDTMTIDPNKGVTLRVGGRELKHDGLYAFQRIDGVDRRVQCFFRTFGDGSIGFTLGDYDPTRTLVIDPLIYSTFLGGEGNDDGSGLAVSDDGHAYVSGWSTSPNFPTTPGAYDSDQNGDYDLFIARFDVDGSRLLAVTFLGGDRDDRPHTLLAAAEGGVYVCGHTDSENFPTTEGAYSRSSAGGRDGFIALLDDDLATLEYSTYIGGGDDDDALSMATGPDGSRYICGTTSSPDFPTSPDAYDHTWNKGANDVDGFVARLSADGTTLTYGTFLGGTKSDGANGIAVDADGNAYLTGQTSSTDFPTTDGAFDRTSHGATDAFAAKLNASGTTLSYSTYLGGSGDDWANAIAVGSNGSAYVCGYTRSLDYPYTERAYDTTWNGNTDGFVTRLSADGRSLDFSTFVGGTQGDNATGLALDSHDDVYVCGGTYSADFGNDPNYSGGADAFLLKLTSSGRDATFRRLLGGSDDDFAFAVILGDDGEEAYLCGTTRSADFPTTGQAYDTSFNGFVDVFLTKLTVDAVPVGVPCRIEPDGPVQLTAAPNPTTGTIRIDLGPIRREHEAVDILLFDDRGAVVGHTTVDAMSSTVVELSGNGLAAGIYHYRVRIDGIDRGTGAVVVAR